MKAAVYHGKHDLRVEDVPVRDLNENEVLIRVKYSGICGTDIHIFNGDGGSSDVEPPLILGHEFSGIIEKIGSNVKRFKKGDRVCADPNDMCGECYFCKNGMPHFCENAIGIGTTMDGAFAEYIIMREKQVYQVPDHVGLEEAAMIEPLSCCLHGIDLCRIRTGDTVLVVGGGAIGLIMVQLAKNAGAGTVILSEPVEVKRKKALEMGADYTINPFAENMKEQLSRLCKNVDRVIECVGNINTIEDAIGCAGKGATILMFGLAGTEEKISVYPDMVFKKELNITSSFINPYTFERSLQVLKHSRIDVKSIISDYVEFDRIVDVIKNPEYRKNGKVMIAIE